MQKKQQPNPTPQDISKSYQKIITYTLYNTCIAIAGSSLFKLCSLEAKLNPAFLALKGVLQVKQPQISICLSFNCVITISIKG